MWSPRDPGVIKSLKTGLSFSVQLCHDNKLYLDSQLVPSTQRTSQGARREIWGTPGLLMTSVGLRMIHWVNKPLDEICSWNKLILVIAYTVRTPIMSSIKHLDAENNTQGHCNNTRTQHETLNAILRNQSDIRRPSVKAKFFLHSSLCVWSLNDKCAVLWATNILEATQWNLKLKYIFCSSMKWRICK